METEQGYYEPTIPREDNVTSLHAEMLRSRDYGDQRLYPNYYQLRAIGDYWADEAKKDTRSERAKKDIGKLTTRILFELASRHQEMTTVAFADLPLTDEPAVE